MSARPLAQSPCLRLEQSGPSSQGLVKEIGNRQKRDDGRKESQCRKEGHYKVIGKRCRHLQRVIALDSGVRPDKRELKFSKLHSAWMRFGRSWVSGKPVC